MKDVLYVNMSRGVEVTSLEVTVSDVATLYSSNQNLVNKLGSLKILKNNVRYGERYLVSIMKIIEMADEECGNVDIVNIGDTDCVIEIKKPKMNENLMNVIKCGIVCLTLFFGAGFSIMSFNNDIGVSEMFDSITNAVADGSKAAKNILEISYSVGLFIGITVFYNHFGPKKLSIDPTPIEVQMREYEDKIYNALIEGHNRSDGKMDIK